MARSRSSRAQRRALERDVIKGKSLHRLPGKEILYRLKYRLNSHQSDQLLLKLEKNHNDLFQYVLGNPLPKTYELLRKTGNTYPEDQLEKEIIWYSKILNRYSKEIKQFLKSKALFDNAILLGKYDDAKSIVNDINTKICYSHWSIENSLLISEFEFGFKANKRQLASIVSENNHLITNILAKFQSIRIEKNISHFKFEEILNPYVGLYEKDDITEYLDFKLNFFSQFNYNFSGFILNYDNNSSILDRYIVFRQILLQELSEVANTLDRNLYIKAIQPLYESIKDPILGNLLISLGEEIEISIDETSKSILECLDFYTKGRYDLSLRHAQKIITDNPEKIEIYEVYIKSCAYLKMAVESPFPEKSIAHRILVDLTALYLKNSDITMILDDLHKLLSTIGISEWSYKLFLIEQNEFPRKAPFNYERYAMMNSSYHNPLMAVSLAPNMEYGKSFLKSLAEQFPNSTTIDFWMSLTESLIHQKKSIESNADINEFRKQLYEVRVLQFFQESTQVIVDVERIMIQFIDFSNLPFNQQELFTVLMHAHIRNGDLLKACDFLAKTIERYTYFTLKLNSDDLFEVLAKNLDENLEKEISIPVIIHQFHSLRDEISGHSIWISYDNFLYRNGLSYPSELFNIKERFDTSLVIYFLKDIAVQEIYSNSYLFENQDQLDNERIEILLKLIKLDEINAKVYKDEISSISRTLLLRKGIKQIDESKIFVDVNGIRDTLSKDLRESFNRSVDLLNLSVEDIAKIDINSDNVLIPYYANDRANENTAVEEPVVRITSYSRFRQFVDMFYKIRDKFIASNEFGIDTALSMRIRHGTLLGETRSVFEKYQLITKKESTTGEYLSNDYWLNQIELESEDSDRFRLIMDGFSAEVDLIADELKNKWLQIKTESKESDGLFDYSYDESYLLRLFRDAFAQIDDYEEFFDSVIDELWKHTELILTKIRNFISNEIKEKSIDLLINLRSQLDALLIHSKQQPVVTELFRNITSCQTGINNEFDIIASWFRRTNNRSINEFDLELPIDASLITLRRLYPEFSEFRPKINNNSNIKIEGEAFTPLTLLFQNLFENIIKHAGLSSTNLKGKINTFEQDGLLKISVENNVSKNINLNERNTKINDSRDLLTKEIGELVRSESGTGFMKIKKILMIDLKRTDFSIDLSDLDESRIFKIEISFPVSGIEKNKDEEFSVD